MGEYIKALRIIHRQRLPMIEDFFNQYIKDLTFNEFLVQAHFDYLKDQNKLTAKNMFYRLPKEYHWIAKKFVIHQTNRVKINWRSALFHLRRALQANQQTAQSLLEYQQEHSPVRGQTPTHNPPGSF